MVRRTALIDADGLPTTKPYEPKYPKGLSVGIELVTPETAKLYLDTQHTNRPISDRQLGSLERILLLNGWHPGISVVYFDSEGRPWDGQHRFTGIANTGQAAYIIAVRGVTPEAALFIDGGRKRTNGDRVAIHTKESGQTHRGGKGHTARAAIMEAIARFDIYGYEGYASTGYIISDEEVLSYLDEPYLDEAATIARRFTGPPMFVSSKSTGLTAVKTLQLDEDTARKFWELAATGEMLSKGNPIYAFRARVMNNPMRNSGMNNVARSLYFLNRTWNAWVDGETLQILKLPVEFSWRDIPELRKP
jgi:hypothetical protein